MAKPIFFQMAEAGKRVTAAWWAVPLAIGILVLGQILGVVLFLSLIAIGALPGQEIDLENLSLDLSSFGAYGQGLMLATTFVFIAILTLLWIFFFERRSLASFGLGKVGAGLVKFARGGLLAIAAMALIAFGLQAVGMAEMTDTAVPADWKMVWPLLILIIGWSVQGSTEEILTRGLLFQSIGGRHGLIVALVISCLFFSIMHGANPNTTVLFFINLIFYSLFVCFYALREGSLWGICGYHAMWNFAQGNIFGFAVSGMASGEGSWLGFVETGPDFITGGSTGPEGGIVTAIVLALSAVAVLMIKPDAHAKEIASAASAKN